MKFKSNARFGQELSDGSIFEFKDSEIEISIHQIIHIEDTWFLSCPELGIRQNNLHTKEFKDAVEKAKIVIKSRLEYLLSETMKFCEDDSEIELVRY